MLEEGIHAGVRNEEGLADDRGPGERGVPGLAARRRAAGVMSALHGPFAMSPPHGSPDRRGAGIVTLTTDFGGGSTYGHGVGGAL